VRQAVQVEGEEQRKRIEAIEGESEERRAELERAQQRIIKMIRRVER
jgi:hypothetical protein